MARSLKNAHDVLENLKEILAPFQIECGGIHGAYLHWKAVREDCDVGWLKRMDVAVQRKELQGTTTLCWWT